MTKRLTTCTGGDPRWQFSTAASLAVGIVVAELALPASALDTHLEVGTAAEHHSNVGRTPEDAQSDTIEILLARLGLQHNSPIVAAQINYDIENQRYAEDTYDSANQINGRSAISWQLWQDRIALLVDHSTATTVANNTQPDIPSNRTRRSVLSAGPRFTARLSAVDNLQLTARKVDVSVKENANVESDTANQNNSERDEAYLQWNHRLSESHALFIGTSYADVSFDELPVQDYRYSSTYAGLELASRLLELSLQAGVNKAERKENTLEDSDGKTFSLELRTREASAPFQASAYYIKAITDTSIGFVGQDALPDSGGSSENLDIVDIVEREQTGVTATFFLGEESTQMTLGASLQKQDYQAQPRDDETRTFSAQLQRHSTAQLRSRLFADSTKRKPVDNPDDNDIHDKRFGIGVDYSFSEALTVRGELYRLKSDNADSTLSYEDNVVRMEFTYALVDQQSAR